MYLDITSAIQPLELSCLSMGSTSQSPIKYVPTPIFRPVDLEQQVIIRTCYCYLYIWTGLYERARVLFHKSVLQVL